MLVVDIEATGTNPLKHSILAIGAVDLSDPEHVFFGECRAWEGAHFMEEALEVVGMTVAQATDPTKPTEAQLVADFLAWSESLADRTLASQNVAFDAAFLQAACERAGVAYPFAHRTIDVHTATYTHMILSGVVPPFDAAHRHSDLSLDAAREYVGLPPEPHPHTALEGALGHAEVLHRLWFGAPFSPRYASYPVSEPCRRLAGRFGEKGKRATDSEDA